MIFEAEHPRPPLLSTLVVRVLNRPRVEIARGYESMEDFFRRCCDVSERYGGCVVTGGEDDQHSWGRHFWLPFGDEPVDEG